MPGRIGKFFKLKALFPTSGIWAPSWAWLSFEPAQGCRSSWTRAPLLPLLCSMYPLYSGNVREIITLISLTLSQLSKVCDGLFPYMNLLESDLFFFLSQALQDPLGSGRSLSVHSQVTCFPFWVLISEKLSSELLHCPPRWIIAHHNHPNA